MKSSTQTILEHTSVPKHIAVIMDGNGRWAKKRFLPRVMGHKRGLDALENMVKHCAKLGVQYLTVFAFSTENWRRPEDEVSFLMGLFLQALQKQVRRLHENNMRLKVLGSRERFNRQILQGIEEAEALTANNTGLTLSIAADYGGRWDIFAGGKQTDCRRRIRDYGRRAGETLDAGRCAGTGFVYPHRRRNAHQQFPALADGVCRTLFYRYPVARF